MWISGIFLEIYFELVEAPTRVIIIWSDCPINCHNLPGGNMLILTSTHHIYIYIYMVHGFYCFWVSLSKLGDWGYVHDVPLQEINSLWSEIQRLNGLKYGGVDFLTAGCVRYPHILCWFCICSSARHCDKLETTQTLEKRSRWTIYWLSPPPPSSCL